MSEILRNIKPSHIKQLVEERTPGFKHWLKDWKKNLDKNKSRITKPIFWREMVHARLTSQNPVGPRSPVGIFVGTSPFPLRYERVRSKRNVEDFIAEKVEQARIGKYKRTGVDLATNLAWLEKGDGWKQALDECNRLTKLPATTDEKKRKRTERAVANYIEDTFSAPRSRGRGRGFGPKQSRNLLQLLGLTRYETPIDIRVMNWLNQYLPPDAQLTSGMLSRRKRYESILDDIQELCRKAKEYPRVFDAAFFLDADRSDG